MKAINFHSRAIAALFNQLIKGKYLVYFIPGLVISIIYYWLSSRFFSYSGEDGFLNKIPLIGEYLVVGVKKTVSIFGFIVDQIYVFVILTVLSPVNTYLSENVDRDLTGQKFEGGIIKFVNDFIRMIFVVILAISLELIFISLWWMVSWIFGFDTVYEIGAYLIAAFFFGFSFYDYSLERYDKGVFSSLAFSFSKLLTVTITGVLFKLIYAIPFIGIAISPVVSTIIATVVYLYHIKVLPKNQDPLINE